MKAPIVSFRNVTKGFRDQTILEDISVDIYPEELTFLMGPSGIGKSVFLKLAIGFEQPDQGEITLGGKHISELDPETLISLHQQYIMIFQHPALFDFLSVIDNVRFPFIERHPKADIDTTYKDAERLLRQLGYTSSLTKFPMDCTLGEGKMVSVARALMLSPEALFFDEPTTGLDEITRSQVDQEIVRVHKEWQKGCVVVSHDVRSAIDIADRVLFLHNKKIYFDSKEPDELPNASDSVVRDFFQPGMLF